MHKKLHILFLLDFFSSFGGTEFYNYNLICGLSERGIRVTVYIGERPIHYYWIDQLKARGIPVFYPDEYHKSSNARTIDLHLANSICQKMNAYQPDLIFAHPMGKLLISCMETGIGSIPIVATDYTIADNNTLHWYQPDLKKFINKISVIIAKCNREEQALRTFLSYSGSIVRIPHLIPEVNSQSVDDADCSSIGCISRLSPEKGLGYLLGAWKKVNESIPYSSLHIYGHGQYEMYYKELCDCLGIMDSVIFEGTFAPITGIDEIAYRHQLYIQPSLFENIPTALIELLLRRRMVIATNVGGICELIPSSSGFIVSPASTDQLSAKIIRAIKQDSSMRWDESIFKNVQRIYDYTTNLDKIISVFQKVANEKWN